MFFQASIFCSIEENQCLDKLDCGNRKEHLLTAGLPTLSEDKRA